MANVEMLAGDREMEPIRIIELPPVRMARSGTRDLTDFDEWWSSVDAEDTNSLSPRDFMWFNSELGRLEWLYALPDRVVDTGPYETFEFPGGLYAVGACEDSEPVILNVNKLIHEWVAKSEVFEESTADNDPHTRYDMGHIVTSRDARDAMGYHQMDVFIPIVCRKHRK